MKRTILGVALACAPMVAAAQEAAPVAQPAMSVQQTFDAASAAMLAGDNAKALALLEALEQRVKNARSLAIVRLRKGMALGKLSRWHEARPLLEQAVAALPADDESLRLDRIQGLIALGQLELGDLDYQAAHDYYAQALVAAQEPDDRISALLGTAQAGIFLDPAKALADAEEAERLAGAAPRPDKGLVGYAAGMRGRALLNLGRFAEAEAAFAKNVRAEGGLTLKVNFDDLVARSDAAIAAMLAGKRDKGREYLVYTGAGRMEKQDFTFAADMRPPQCGEEGIRPEDVAVVEFGIGENGAVSYARPVYGSRRGGMALAFAQAVREWSWRPEDVAKIPALFRMVTRLELRCSTAQGGPNLAEGARKAFRDWIEATGVERFEATGDSEAIRREALMQQLARLRAAPDTPPLARAAVLAELLANPLVTGRTAEEYVADLKAIVTAAGAPLMARLWVDVLETGTNWKRALPEASYVADAPTYALARLINYDRAGLKAGRRGDRAVLDAIIADSRLAKDDPVRVAALVRRASARVADKDLAAARADYLETGLDAQQCSIVDAKPALRSTGVSSADYPEDLVRVGIEGWSRVEHDIAADGRTTNVRVVAAYPPMAFSTNASKIVGHIRYEQSYRPDGALGCSGSNANINFKMPG